MPGGDRTGPMGMGPMTGRAAGYCAGYPVPGFMNPIPGYGGWGRAWGRPWGAGWGRGMGWGRGLGSRSWAAYPYSRPWGVVPPAWSYAPWGSRYGSAPPTKEEESKFLKDQAEFLQKELQEIQRRISELESKPEEPRT
jgi:hypothetical protein